MELVQHIGDSPKSLSRFVHFPYSNPVVVGSARGWCDAFDAAAELFSRGQLHALTLTRSDHYPRIQRFKITRLSDRAHPLAMLAWMKKFTPLMHPHVAGVDMYLVEGYVLTDAGHEECWRLDCVYH